MGGSDSTGTTNGADLVGNVLAHHGIKGMKWGSRKAAGASSSPSHPASADHETVTKFKDRSKSSGVKSLSNDELQKVVTRMNLEQQYRSLKSQQPSKFDKGQAHVKKVLGVAKTLQEIHGVYKSPLGQLVVNQLKNRAG